MGWLTTLQDTELDDEGLSPQQRAVQLKRFAQKVVRMARTGKLDPEQILALRQAGHEVSMDLEDLGEDETGAFTPAQRAQLRRLARNLRAYARQVGHMHTHGKSNQLGKLRMGGKYNLLPGGLAAGKKPSDFDRTQLMAGTRHEMEHTSDPALAREIAMDHLAEDPGYYRAGKRRKRRLTAVPISGWEADSEDDPELGFLPALLPILGAAAPLIGGLLGGGDKKAPAPAPAPAGPPQVVLGGGGAASGGAPSLPAIGGVVADQIRAVPPPIRQQVVDGVRELMDRQKAGQMDVAAMLKSITELLGPKLKSQLESVNQAALQRQATYEHESLKRRDERWKNNAEAQRRILARLDEMETKLGTAVQSKQRRMNAAARAFGIPARYM